MKRLIIVPVVVLASIAFLQPAAYASTVLAGFSSGYAHGGYASVPVITTHGGSTTTFLGPIAPTWEGCNISPASANDSVSTASLGSFVNAGIVQDVVTTNRSATSVTAQASSILNNVNILHGLITASVIRTVASSIGTATSGTSTDTGSSFTRLRIAGIPIIATPGPNTTMQIAGLGYVVLNEQVGPYNGFSASSININMIDVYITVSNSFGISSGSQIVVGHASSNFVRTSQPALVHANAIGIQGKGMAGLVSFASGPVAYVEIGCSGGHAQNGVVGTSLSSLGNTGIVTDSASGQLTSSGSNAQSQVSIANVNLLKGLIQGRMVTAAANVVWKNTGSESTSATFINVKVAGILLSQSPAPNTLIRLPGIGYVVLNERSSHVSSSGVFAAVNAFDLVITTSNAYGLSVGAQIILGSAQVSASSYSPKQ